MAISKKAIDLKGLLTNRQGNLLIDTELLTMPVEEVLFQLSEENLSTIFACSLQKEQVENV